MGPTNSRKVGWIKMAPIIRDPITLILTLSLFFCPQLIPLVVAVLSPLVEEDLFPEYYRQEVPPLPVGEKPPAEIQNKTNLYSPLT